MSLTVVPAYGRDYKSKKEVMADWDAGKDFLIQDMSSQFDGRYINKPQVESGQTIMVRYKKKTQVLPIKVS